ncbi:hypothetical protein QJS10_CPB11g01198 [Acorus calamus]|nr:hypothetical protein QJS10_CPB17g00777 [Acorus calamus]KAK1303613.1 hypothetical protein QJS10_CPB11g01198 [Acorus calamus]
MAATMRVTPSLFLQSSVSYCLPLSQETKNPWKLESGFCRPAGGFAIIDPESLPSNTTAFSAALWSSLIGK